MKACQPALPGLEAGEPPVVAAPAAPTRRLSDLQREQGRERTPDQPAVDPLQTFLLLQEELGRLAGALRERREGAPVRAALASVLGQIIRLANDAGIDLEEAYFERFRPPEPSAGRVQPDAGGAPA